MDVKKEKKIILAGGGTGGHILAGLAIAEEWKKIFTSENSVAFIGIRGAMEDKLIPKTMPFFSIEIGSLNRVSWKKKWKTILQLPKSFKDSFTILRQEKPDFVLGVGGYASGPVLWVASLLGIPTAIIEQNSIPGLTNRILGKWVRYVWTAFEGTERYFAPHKTTLMGNPIRSLVSEPLPSSEFAQGKKDKISILIIGGSQGALGLNRLILDWIKNTKFRSKMMIRHQTGTKFVEEVTEEYQKIGFQDFQVEDFIHDMKTAYLKADLVICRSGSSTLFELAAVQRAAIAVPLPTASDDHQTENARSFERKNALQMVAQNSGWQELEKKIEIFFQNPNSISFYEKAMGQARIADSAKKVVHFIEKILNS